MRIVKLIVRADEVMVIYKTLVESFPVLGSFVIILSIFLFMFSVIGVQLFALNDVNPIDGLDRQM